MEPSPLPRLLATRFPLQVPKNLNGPLHWTVFRRKIGHRHKRAQNRAVSTMCDNCVMAEITSRELRNDLPKLLKRVAEGEHFVITIDGQPRATLQALDKRPRWVSGAEFAGLLDGYQTDSGLREDLRVLAPDSTDDIP